MPNNTFPPTSLNSYVYSFQTSALAHSDPIYTGMSEVAAEALEKIKGMTKKKSPEVWIRKSKKKRPSFNIASIMGNREVVGDIGIEIECEGKNLPRTEYSPFGKFKPELIPSQWTFHHDGSLRGQENAEYVLTRPLSFAEAPKAIEDLWDMFKTANTTLDESNRTSVHIHLNATRWHLNRLTAFTALYFVFEELLTEWCGDHRVGNLFCLRAKDAPAIISKIKTFVIQDGASSLSEGLHYSGLNVYSLCKFGSIEIRTLRGCTTKEPILTWIKILERLYKVSEDYSDPRRICDGFSGQGPIAYMDAILGDLGYIIRSEVSWDNQRIMQSLYEGIRLAQDLCYCRDWSEFVAVDLNSDPFGRTMKSVAQSMEDVVVGAVPVPPIPDDSGGDPWITSDDIYIPDFEDEDFDEV